MAWILSRKMFYDIWGYIANSPETRFMNKRFISTSFRITFVVCWNCFLPCARKTIFWSNILSRNGKRKYLDFPKDESINLDSNRYSWCRPPLKRTKKMARDWKYFLLSLIGGLGTLLKNDARKIKRASENLPSIYKSNLCT